MRQGLFLALLLFGCCDYSLLRNGVPPLTESGAADASVEDATNDAANVGACTGAIFCEPFEGKLSTGWVGGMSGSVELELDGIYAHAGSQATHVCADPPMNPPMNAYSALRYLLLPPPPNLHVRAFVYRPAPTTGNVQVFRLVKNVGSDLRRADGHGGRLPDSLFHARTGRPGGARSEGRESRVQVRERRRHRAARHDERRHAHRVLDRRLRDLGPADRLHPSS